MNKPEYFSEFLDRVEREEGQLIIGFGHKAQVGKDTAADWLRMYGFQRVGFADSLKETCRAAFGFTQEQLYGSEKMIVDAYWDMTPVEALQKVGTNLFRDGFDEDFWVKSAVKKINKLRRVVISDVRFPNEVEAIHDLGGIVIRVDRPNRPDTGRDPNHPSETALDGIEYYDSLILNDGTLSEYHDKIGQTIRQVYT